MRPATEARLLALATALGMDAPRVTVRPTTGAGSRTYRKGFAATASGLRRSYDLGGGCTAEGATEDAALEALEARLVRRLRDGITYHREQAASHGATADRLEAALTAALATPEHATTPAPVCPAPTEGT